MPKSARNRQASRRERELAAGRRGRLLFLTDEEFIKVKEILSFVRDAEEGQTTRIEMTRIGDEK